MKPASSSQRLTLQIDNLTSDGEGVARRNRDIYFVPGALPGEEVEVVLDGRRRKVWRLACLTLFKPPTSAYNRNALIISAAAVVIFSIWRMRARSALSRIASRVN